MKLRAVIFDFDGLMVDTEPAAQSAWRRAFSELGFPIDDRVLWQVVGKTMADVEQLFLATFTPELPVQELFALKTSYTEQHYAEHGIALKTGLIDLLDLLEWRHIHKAVASSTYGPLLVKKLELARLKQRFEVVVSGDEVHRGKPAADIFLQAARRLQVQPEECIVLEDSGPGIQAAHAAGMIPILVPDLLPPAPEICRLAYRVVDSLFDVPALLLEFW